MTRDVRPAWSSTVAAVLRKTCEVTHSNPSLPRVARSTLSVFDGSRSPPSTFGKTGLASGRPISRLLAKRRRSIATTHDGSGRLRSPVGDSVSDVLADFGCVAIGYANKPCKLDRLRQAGAQAVVSSMQQLSRNDVL